MLEKAEKAAASLRTSKGKKEYRHHWLNTIDLYRVIFEAHPTAPEAPAAVQAVARLYQGLHGRSGIAADLDLAVYYFRRLVKTYPTSSLADDSLMAVGDILLNQKHQPELAFLEYEKVVDGYPRGDMYRKAAGQVSRLARHRPAPTACPTPPSAPRNGKMARVTSIRHWTNPDFTRVVVDLDAAVKFTHNTLPPETKDAPPRLCLDLFAASLPTDGERQVSIGDGLVAAARAGQFSRDTVRVVLDLAAPGKSRVFSLSDPFRIVADVYAGEGALQVARDDASPPAPAAPPPTLAQQLGLSIRKVVLDPGHGGHDPGALGVGGLQEKEVALDVARRLRTILTERHGLEVVMTRDSDVFIPLEERTALANTAKADLFLSIHCNASKRKVTRGIETYFLNLASSREAAETAAQENMTSETRIADFERTMVDLFMSMKIDESSRFARMVQEGLARNIRERHPDAVDLGVKQAPFVVLIGAQMPSVLTELSFINHPDEGKLLAQESYRQELAEALAGGVTTYIGSINLISSR
jgi:N-acetylmuramoyl-L-alanine amidase